MADTSMSFPPVSDTTPKKEVKSSAVILPVLYLVLGILAAIAWAKGTISTEAIGGTAIAFMGVHAIVVLLDAGKKAKAYREEDGKCAPVAWKVFELTLLLGLIALNAYAMKSPFMDSVSLGTANFAFATILFVRLLEECPRSTKEEDHFADLGEQEKAYAKGFATEVDRRLQLPEGIGEDQRFHHSHSVPDALKSSTYNEILEKAYFKFIETHVGKSQEWFTYDVPLSFEEYENVQRAMERRYPEFTFPYMLNTHTFFVIKKSAEQLAKERAASENEEV
jgi:hypothetical protein